ncbi:HAD family hydrolase [Vibrio paucivorans]|uniref:HAD-IB family hydrolase n=1 Tax=Vibrio paucivorans TaxID=2829489 RepID=A0A9X3CFD8_9VIBR|nr:HAD family hydrolase [Vibrio paucivorans]MCW8334454.1 HAD-IB family hydrolase [Vibrio paucivorans]
MTQPLYVFDLDETLINGDCAMIWNEFMVEKGIVSDPNFLQQDEHLMALYARGEMNMEEYLTFCMAPLLHHPKAQVMEWVEECVTRDVLPKLFPQAKQLITELKRDQIDMLIISASVAFLVEAVADKIGIEQAIGIDLKEQDHRFTSKVVGTASYREGKVTRLKQWLAATDKRYDSIHFFTDSINDLPLCLHADHVYLVNPCERLNHYLVTNNGQKTANWQRLNWG